MSEAITFKVTPIGIPENEEGATRLLSHIAKPVNHSIAMKKLRDFLLLIDGEAPYNNRSREQVKDACSVVWMQIRRAIEVGDWYDRMFPASPSGRVETADMAAYARTLALSIDGADKQIVWKPYLPVVHMAAGFRVAMMLTNRGRFFGNGQVPRSVQLQQLQELISEDYRWMNVALEQAQARLLLHRMHRRQAPTTTRMFVSLAVTQDSPPNSQKSPPDA